MSNVEKKVSAEISITDKGPIKISGNFKVLGIDGEVVSAPSEKEIYLCACGHSARKPFCDGSHKK